MKFEDLTIGELRERIEYLEELQREDFNPNRERYIILFEQILHTKLNEQSN